MAIHGGRNKTAPVSDIRLFNFSSFFLSLSSSPHFLINNLESKEWQELKGEEGMTPTARYFHSVVEGEGSIWIFGGLGLESPGESKSKNLGDFYAFYLSESYSTLSGEKNRMS